MFNMHNKKINKQAMAYGPRAIQDGNFSAGARRFRLVEISEENCPKIAKIRDSINSTYSDDGGQLYFLFSAENRYSEEMDVNDDRTLEKMRDENMCRKDFVSCIYLEDFYDLPEDKQKIALSDSNLPSKLAQFIVSQETVNSDNPKRREKIIEITSKRLLELDFAILENMYNNKETAHLFAQFLTDKKENANPFRFSIDNNKLEELGSYFNGENGLPVYETYALYMKSANYHNEVSGKGEIQMLDDSISKLETMQKEGGKKYGVNEYITSKIEEIKDEQYKKNMKWAWSVTKQLKLPLQYPSWIAIGWPQDSRYTSNIGANRGDNKKIDNLEDISFVDEESGKKLVWKKGSLQVPIKSEGMHLPVTPHTTLLEIIGKKPSISGKQKSPEYVRSRFEVEREKILKAKNLNKKNLLNKARYLKTTLTYYEMIRDNLNSFGHQDVNSFFYLYDELCDLYFSYNRDRYGDGIMLQYSAFYDNNGHRTISPDRRPISGRTNRPFIPTTLHDDLREIIISVHYAYGTDIPHCASTILPGNGSLILDKNMLNKMVEKANEKGIEKLTIQNNMPVVTRIPATELVDFFTKMAKGKVLVFRTKKEIDQDTKEETSNIVWYAGMRSFADRYDEKLKTKRIVYDEEDGLIEIEGYGKSRISLGTSSLSNEFRKKLAIMQSFDEKGNKMSVGDWNDVYVDSNLMNVYNYANQKWGLDYNYDKIKEMSAKKIKPISNGIFQEMETSSQSAINKEIKDQESKNKRIIITEDTNNLVKEIISEIAKESLENNRNEKIEKAPIIQNTMTEDIDAPIDIQVQNESDNHPENDIREYENYKIIEDLAGGIALEQTEVESLKQKGYTLELQPNDLYIIVQSPPWVIEEVQST